MLPLSLIDLFRLLCSLNIIHVAGGGSVQFVSTTARAFLTACIALFALSAYSQDLEPRQIIFSGFGYGVAFESISDQFPNSSAALSDVDFDRELMGDLEVATQPSKLRVVGDQLGRLGEGQDAYVLALVLENERVSQTKLDGQYKIVITLAYSAEVFDFDRKELVAAFPKRIVYVDFRREPPSAQYLRQLFTKLIIGKENSVRSGFWETVARLNLPTPSTRRIRVSSITLPENFEWAMGSDPAPYADNLGRLISSAIGEASGVAVLPFSNNQVLSGKMASRIANAEVFNFTIPEEDYAIEIKFTGFKKLPLKKSGAGQVFVYGAYADFTVKEPFSGALIYQASMKHGESKTVPRGMVQVSDIEPMQRVGELFLNGFAVAIATDDEKWERTHLADKSSRVGSLKSLKEVLDQCR